MSDEPQNDQVWLARHLRRALTALYDPTLLRTSPLLAVFDLARQRDPVAALRQVLLDGIEALRPSSPTPHDSKMWRIYHILRRRYIEQMPQPVVASDFGLSTRQLQREESDARSALAYLLWDVHQLEGTIGPLRQNEDLEPGDVPTYAQELQWLEASTPLQRTDINAMLRQALATLEPVFQSSQVEVVSELANDIPGLHMRSPLLRQALLNLLGMVSQSAPQGRVFVSSHHAAPHTEIRLLVTVTEPAAWVFDSSMTHQLIELSGGRLSITASPYQFEGRITVTADHSFSVLVIDDNADTQQLFERYLTGSRYRYTGAVTSAEGLALANSAAPDVIILDVMMPESDGWTLLGQLRYQPATSHIPVIVCTILAQEELALALGADDFIRKPVNRPALLSALDRQFDLLATDAD